jgi:hypothetical protein
MRHDDSGQQGPRGLNSTQWFTGISIALVVMVCLVIFAIAFVQIDPYLSDFVSDAPEPAATPSTAPNLPIDADPASDGEPSGRLLPVNAMSKAPLLYSWSP